LKAANKSLLLAVIVAGIGFLFAPEARSQESIWSGLVLGTNQEHPKPAPPALERYWAKLKNIFGYNQYELLGEHLEVLTGAGEHWLIPRKDFFLRVDSHRGERPGYYSMKMDFYQEKNLLGQMEASVSGSSQNVVFIRGPEYDSGRIIIILLVK
jgi:hypothetical protein